MMLKLKLQYFGDLMWRVDSLEKILILGGIGGRRRRGRLGWDSWMASWTRRTCVWVNSGSWWWTGRAGVLRFMGLQRVRQAWATELSDWLTEHHLGSHKWKSLSSVQLFVTPWTVQSMEFSRPEYWSGFPSPGELPNPGIEPRSSTLQADQLSHERSPKHWRG